MNNMHLAIPNIYESVERKLFTRVVKDLVSQGFLPYYDRLRIWDHIEKAKVPGTSTNKRRPSTKLWSRDEVQIRVNVEKEVGPGADRSVSTMDHIVRPCFHDDILGITLRPQYYEEAVTLTIRARSSSYSNLRLWANQVEMKRQRGIDRQTHDHQFSYGLNDDTYRLLKILYDLREAQFGYGEEFAEYVKRYSSNNLETVRSGRHWRLEFSEKVLGIEGFFGTTPTITEVTDALYEGTMYYTLTYFKPLGIIHNYPILIHQQLIPEMLLTRKDEDYQNVYIESPLVRSFMDVGLNTPDVIRVPHIDHEPVKSFPTSYSPLVIFLVCLTAGTLDEVLFNLDQLEDVEFDEDLLRIIRSTYWKKITYPYNCPFHICIHRNDVLLDYSYIKVDADLNVRLTKPLDPRGVYRVSVCVSTAPHKVDRASYDVLEREPRVRSALANAMNHVDGMFGNNHMVNQRVIPRDLTHEYYYTHVIPTIHRDPTIPPYIPTKSVDPDDPDDPYTPRVPVTPPDYPEDPIPPELDYPHEYLDFDCECSFIEVPYMRDVNTSWGIISNMTVMGYYAVAHRLEDLQNGHR